MYDKKGNILITIVDLGDKVMKIFNEFKEKIAVYRIAVFVLTVFLFITSHRLYVLSSEKVSNTVHNLSVSVANKTFGGKYFVFTDENFVAIKDCTDKSDAVIFDKIDVRTMRREDRYKFEKGFYLNSESELLELLEDYGS